MSEIRCNLPREAAAGFKITPEQFRAELTPRSLLP